MAPAPTHTARGSGDAASLTLFPPRPQRRSVTQPGDSASSVFPASGPHCSPRPSPPAPQSLGAAPAPTPTAASAPAGPSEWRFDKAAVTDCGTPKSRPPAALKDSSAFGPSRAPWLLVSPLLNFLPFPGHASCFLCPRRCVCQEEGVLPPEPRLLLHAAGVPAEGNSSRGPVCPQSSVSTLLCASLVPCVFPWATLWR